MLIALIAIVLLWGALQYVRFHRKRRKLTDAISKLPGPPEVRIPILANFINILSYEYVAQGQFGAFVLLYHEFLANCHVFLKEGIHRFWVGWIPFVVLYSPETIEPILKSNTLIAKADLYRVIEPWIGQGLLTSKGNKWRSRRKIITPAFHFRMLNDFLPIVNRSASTLIMKLTKIKYSCLFDVNSPISQCTLDTISSTAMGIDLKCQAEEQSDYVRAIDEVQRLVLHRVARAWLWPDWIFYKTAVGKKFSTLRDFLHDFTEKVILERKAQWEKVLKSESGESPGQGSNEAQMSFDDIRQSKRFKGSHMQLAFLDLLLHQHLVEKSLTTEDIIEEVSTFLFAVSISGLLQLPSIKGISQVTCCNFPGP